MNEAVEDCVCQCVIAYFSMPFGYGKLTGDNRRAPSTPVFKNIEQVVSSAADDGRQAPIIKYYDVCLGQRGHQFGIRAIGARNLDGFEKP